MRLLFIQETDWLKRYPAQQHHLAELMALRGHNVLAIDYELSWRQNNHKGIISKSKIFTGINKIHPEAKITIIRPGFIKLPVLDYASMLFSHRREIKRQIKEFSPDAIIGFGILNSMTAVRLVKNTDIPFLYYWLDVLHLLIPNRIFRPIGKFIEHYALKRADTSLAINEKLHELIVKLGAPPDRTKTIRAGIDFNKFTGESDSMQTRQKYGLLPDDRVIFFMGFLYHFAGLKEVILKMAEQADNNLKLMIIGEGDAYNELRVIIDRYDLHNTVILAGKKPYEEIPSLIAAADICLLPAYRNEPIMQDIVPIKLYEYMAMKKPVIAARLPGVYKEFGEGNGMVYIDTPEQAVDKAIELFNNYKLKELGEKARRFAERNSWDKIASQFEEALKEAIKSKNGTIH